MGYFFSENESQKIIQLISDIESRSQGEVRIHIEDLCEKPPVERAIEVFNKLKMGDTAEKTGVLIYLAYSDKKIAIIGDSGINQAVPSAFWEGVVSVMISLLKQERLPDAINLGLKLVGEKLLEKFPKKEGNTNELSNEISYGDI